MYEGMFYSSYMIDNCIQKVTHPQSEADVDTTASNVSCFYVPSHLKKGF